MAGLADFWDDIAERYARDPVRNPDAYATTLSRARHWLHPSMQVLEIGCGTGSTALTLAEAVEEYTGADVSGEMIRIAEDKAQEAQVPNLSFTIAEATQVSGPWDAVLAFNLLHLLPDLPATLAHLRAQIPQGGMFITKTPCLGHRPWFRPLVWGMQMLGKAPLHVNHLTPKGLERMILDAGFEILETGDYPARPPSRFIVARAMGQPV